MRPMKHRVYSLQTLEDARNKTFVPRLRPSLGVYSMHSRSQVCFIHLNQCIPLSKLAYMLAYLLVLYLSTFGKDIKKGNENSLSFCTQRHEDRGTLITEVEENKKEYFYVIESG